MLEWIGPSGDGLNLIQYRLKQHAEIKISSIITKIITAIIVTLHFAVYIRNHIFAGMQINGGAMAGLSFTGMQACHGT